MKVWPFSVFARLTLRLILLSALLAACCPAPLHDQPTAFRGVVVGVSSEISALHLESPGAPLLTLSVPENSVHTSTGEALPLTALRRGDAVYVQGTVRNGELRASEVRRLEH